jgi:hypothetical protein
MRDLQELDTFCIGKAEDGGAFVLRSPTDHAKMFIVASFGESWDHVSVSREKRCPNWIEMEYVKRTFFKDDETAMQLHVPPADHINNMPYVLHLWRPQHCDIPRPPGILVGHSRVGRLDIRN